MINNVISAGYILVEFAAVKNLKRWNKNMKNRPLSQKAAMLSKCCKIKLWFLSNLFSVANLIFTKDRKKVLEFNHEVILWLIIELFCHTNDAI